MEEVVKKNRKPEITDDEALAVVEEYAASRSKASHVATHFVTRTIVYPVAIEYQPGVFTKELRTFVRQYEYCSAAQWQEALELEKKYPKLNKQYKDNLKARKLPVDVKEPANPMNTTIIEI